MLFFKLLFEVPVKIYTVLVETQVSKTNLYNFFEHSYIKTTQVLDKIPLQYWYIFLDYAL